MWFTAFRAYDGFPFTLRCLITLAYIFNFVDNMFLDLNNMLNMLNSLLMKSNDEAS